MHPQSPPVALWARRTFDTTLLTRRFTQTTRAKRTCRLPFEVATPPIQPSTRWQYGSRALAPCAVGLALFRLTPVTRRVAAENASTLLFCSSSWFDVSWTSGGPLEIQPSDLESRPVSLPPIAQQPPVARFGGCANTSVCLLALLLLDSGLPSPSQEDFQFLGGTKAEPMKVNIPGNVSQYPCALPVIVAVCAALCTVCRWVSDRVNN